MDDKQIIIDGVDVKDCKRRIGKDNYCRYYKRLCSENNYNCIWKKYLRKEQECNKLYIQLKADEEYHKEEENTLRKIIKNKEERNIELYKENNQLKVKNEKLKESLKVWKFSDVQHIFKINKYEQTLTEIKKIAEREVKHAPDGETFSRPEIKQILQKISEVLNGTNP